MKYKLLINLTLVCFFLAQASLALSKQLRVGLFVGNNQGALDDVPLRYAERDAKRLHQTLSSLGELERSWLLIDQDAQAVQDALLEIKTWIQQHETSDHQKVDLIIFYSGHADANFLRLSSSRLRLEKFKSLASEAKAGLTLFIIDACRNRSPSIPKGVQLDTPLKLAVEQVPSASGTIVIHSVREGEMAVESDAMQGSVFTHHLIASLQGAADLNADGQVSLQEAYLQTRSKTMLTSLQEIGQLQHPTFDLDFKGEKDMVLTTLSLAASSLVFPEEISGHFYIAEKYNGSLFSELVKEDRTIRKLALPRGEYLVYRSESRDILVSEVYLQKNKETVLSSDGFARYPKTQVLTKGGQIQIRRTGLEFQTELDTGWLSGLEFLPSIGLRTSYRTGSWEWFFNGVFGMTVFEAKDSSVDNRLLGFGLGVGRTFSQAYGTFCTELELRPLWLAQSTEGNQSRNVFVGQLRSVQRFQLPISAWTSLSFGFGLSLSVYQQNSQVEAKPSLFGQLGYRASF